MSSTPKRRARCPKCGYMALVRINLSLDGALLYKHKRQTNCDNIMVEQKEKA